MTLDFSGFLLFLYQIFESDINYFYKFHKYMNDLDADMINFISNRLMYCFINNAFIGQFCIFLHLYF